MKLIVLAAGQGTRLRPLTDQRPKCLVEVAKRSILDRLLDAAGAVGLTDIIIIGGYRAEMLRSRGYRVILNPHFAETNMVRTLFCAEQYFGEGFILSYGDIFFRPDILRRMVVDAAPISVAVDMDWQDYWSRRFENPLDDAETLRIEDGRIIEIGGKPTDTAEIEAQYMGLLAFRGQGVAQLRDAYVQAQREEAEGSLRFGRAKSVDAMYLTDLLQGMADRGHALTPVTVHGGWVEIDSHSDLVLAEQMLAEGRFGKVR